MHQNNLKIRLSAPFTKNPRPGTNNVPAFLNKFIYIKLSHLIERPFDCLNPHSYHSAGSEVGRLLNSSILLAIIQTINRVFFCDSNIRLAH